MTLRFSKLVLFGLGISHAQAQPQAEPALVKANRIEQKLRTTGITVLGHYANGFVPVETRYKKSFADSKGKLISNIEYANVRDFSNGYASVNRNNGWTIIDSSGQELFEPDKQFSGIGPVRNGVMKVTSKKENRTGLARISGEVIAPMEYRFLNLLDNISGNYLATVDGKYKLLDSLGTPLSEHLFEDFSAAENSRFYAAKLDGNWIILDLLGKIKSKTKLRYDFVEGFSNGFAVVRKNGKVGFINEEGAEKLPLIYDDALAFNEYGNAPIKNGSSYAMVNKQGKVFLKGCYERVLQLNENMFRLIDATSQFVTDRLGKQLWPEKYYLIEPISKDLYKVIPLTDDRKPYFANALGMQLAVSYE